MTDEEKATELRAMLGESIPDGGDATDTLVTDEQITAWVDAYDSLALAAVKGWEIKMAYYSGLVDVTDGAASRKLSDLMDHALRMRNLYADKGLGPTAGRARVGKIIRT